MQVMCELPMLEKVIEEGLKRGFTIVPPKLNITGYCVSVICEGVSRTAWVQYKKRYQQDPVIVLDTGGGYWRDDKAKQTRLRIHVGKTVNIIGNRLKWVMAKFGKTEMANSAAEEVENVQNIVVTS